MTSHVRSTLLAAGAGLYYLTARRERGRVERLAAAALESLLNAIDANDPATGAHVRRVAALSLILADACGLSERERSSVERVALFHDVGKIHEALFDITHDDHVLSDTFDAITQHRRYGTARSTPDAVEVIAAERGGQFDPELADVFLSPAVQRLVGAAMQSPPLSQAVLPYNRKPARADVPDVPVVPDVSFRWRVLTV
jgi:HD-GYP domain-containing protein (c-di-GMP phosphodiesterase class II)